jgi:hypothetical protein
MGVPCGAAFSADAPTGTATSGRSRSCCAKSSSVDTRWEHPTAISTTKVQAVIRMRES